MEEQENLEKIGIGEKEAQKLEPAEVDIVKANVETVGNKNAKKVVCEVKHPVKEETIHISSAKVEQGKDKVKVVGLWFNKDEDGKIRKGSATALFLQSVGAQNVEELAGKKVGTVEDENGYLAFKAY